MLEPRKPSPSGGFGCLMLLIIILIILLLSSSSKGQNKPRPPHPPELTSSKEIVAEQNKVAERLGVPIILDDEMLKEFTSEKTPDENRLVRLVNTPYCSVTRVNPQFRWTHQWVRDYIDDLSKRYYAISHERLQIVSATRTLKWQKLMTTKWIYDKRGRRHRNRAYNPNAFIDTDNPDVTSLHTFALAFDISTKQMTPVLIMILQEILITDTKNTQNRVQVAEESIKIRHRHAHRRRGKRTTYTYTYSYRIIAYHCVIFNASFLNLYSK